MSGTLAMVVSVGWLVGLGQSHGSWVRLAGDESTLRLIPNSKPRFGSAEEPHISIWHESGDGSVGADCVSLIWRGISTGPF